MVAAGPDPAPTGPPAGSSPATPGPDAVPAPAVPPGEARETFATASLKNRTLAAVLSWLVPGLGQVYQGRAGKGGLFAVCVLGMFVFGLILGRGHVVYLDFHGPWYEWRLHYLAQMFVGGPSLPAIGQFALVSAGAPPITEFEAPPYRAGEVRDSRGRDRLTEWHLRSDMDFDMGTIYTMLAGLLNVFVILDAYAGPLPPPADEPDPDETPDRAKS